MRSILIAALIFISTSASAAGDQLATLISFESVAVRPDVNKETTKTFTSIIGASMEYTSEQNLSVYAGFQFVIGDNFETAPAIGARFYSSSPALQFIPGLPVWSFIGGGMSFLDENVFYPEAGFRIAISDVSRIDLFVKILNSSSDTYDKNVMVGAALTF